MPNLQLASLPASFRLGLVFLVLVLLGGLGVSATHLWWHHENRDGRPGLTMDDLVGVYAGIQSKAPLRLSLERGHPKDLPPADRAALEQWLASSDLAQAYDDTKAGDRAPAEILDRRCLTCHARAATAGDGIGKKMPLEYWDDVRVLAQARDVEPNAPAIVIASAHTHALGMGSLTVIAVLLAACTRWPRRATGALALLAGAGLLVDLACWLPARSLPFLVPLLAGSGATWMVCTAMLLLAALAELVLPERRAGAGQLGADERQAST